MILIASATTGSNATEVVFSNIPQTYRHLMITGSIRGTTGSVSYSSSETILNSRTTNDYQGNTLIRSTRSNTGSSAADGMFNGAYYTYYNTTWDGMSNNNWSSTVYGSHEYWLLDYTSTWDKSSLVREANPRYIGVNDSVQNIMFTPLMINSGTIGAVTSVTVRIYNGGETFAVGSRLYLYGTKNLS